MNISAVFFKSRINRNDIIIIVYDYFVQILQKSYGIIYADLGKFAEYKHYGKDSNIPEHTKLS